MDFRKILIGNYRSPDRDLQKFMDQVKSAFLKIYNVFNTEKNKNAITIDGDIHCKDIYIGGIKITAPTDAQDNYYLVYNRIKKLLEYVGDANMDHGSISGLTDDDHPQYILADGTRAFSSYMDLTEITAPAKPGSNILRLFVEDTHGFSYFKFIDSSGMVRSLVRDSVILVKNERGSTIAASRIVYASGSTGEVPLVDTAKADSLTTMPAIGVTIESIANGAYGRVMQVGLLENVNTSAFSAGDVLYVSAATAGVPTATPPTYPNVRQEIGTVLASDASVGSIQIVARSILNETIIDHDGLLNFVENEHIDWTATPAAKSLDLTAGAYFKPRRIRQATQPTPEAGELLIWSDSDDDTVYLVYNDSDGGTVQVQLS